MDSTLSTVCSVYDTSSGSRSQTSSSLWNIHISLTNANSGCLVWFSLFIELHLWVFQVTKKY